MGLNRAYDVKEDRSVWAIFVLQVLVVIGGALVFVVVAYLLVLAPIAGSFAHRLVPGFEPALVTLDVVRYPSAAAITMAALFAAHIFLPARWIRFSNMWPGVIFTVIAWLALRWRVFAVSRQFRQLCELLCRSRGRDRCTVFPLPCRARPHLRRRNKPGLENKAPWARVAARFLAPSGTSETVFAAELHQVLKIEEQRGDMPSPKGQRR